MHFFRWVAQGRIGSLRNIWPDGRLRRLPCPVSLGSEVHLVGPAAADGHLAEVTGELARNEGVIITGIVIFKIFELLPMLSEQSSSFLILVLSGGGLDQLHCSFVDVLLPPIRPAGVQSVEGRHSAH